MAPQTATRMTYDEFMALPEEEGIHYELIEGELFVNPSPVTKHQRILRKFLSALDRYFEEHGGGEVFCSPYDVVLSKETVLEPDLLVVRSERAKRVGEKNMQGAPDIAIEILSEGTRRKDLIVKRRLYEQFGVDEYWIVDPVKDTVQIYRRSGTNFGPAIAIERTITTPLLPSFTLDVNRIFAA